MNAGQPGVASIGSRTRDPMTRSGDTARPHDLELPMPPLLTGFDAFAVIACDEGGIASGRDRAAPGRHHEPLVPAGVRRRVPGRGADFRASVVPYGRERGQTSQEIGT